MFLTYVFEEDEYGRGIEYIYEITLYEIDEVMEYILKDYTREDLIELIIDKVDLRKYFIKEITHYFKNDAKIAYLDRNCY